MIETANPEINVEELMGRIREEVARRKAQALHPQTSPAAAAPSAAEATVTLPLYPHAAVSLPRAPESGGCVAHKPEYALGEFLDYHDEDFVRSAYLGILRREPDAGDFARYVNLLRTGRLSKAEILGQMRYSPEGKACAVPVHGLMLHFALHTAYRIPVLGYGLALANFIVRLPVIVRNWKRFEAATLRQQREQGLQLNSLVSQVEGVISQLQQELGRLGEELAQKAGVAQVEALAAQTGEKIFSLTQALETKADNERLTQLTNHLVDLVQRKADAGELAATATRLGEELAQKAGVAQVEALAAQTGEKVLGLTQALETKADNERLTQLTNHLVDLEQRKADAGELAATATRLGEELAQKAGVVQVEALAAQTGEKVLGLTQALETKADAAAIQRETREIQHQILDHKHNILDQQRRLALLLEEARKRLPEPISTGQIENMVAEEDHLLDAFYVSFEDRFRGTREDIKQRVAIYLPIVREAKAGTKKAPILDIGCGRGEWLELLQENDLVARGVDLNRVMVSQCQELGLEVAEADVIAYLRGLKTKSLGAVTGMHIIEHIPFKRLVALFDEVLRVLKPGGVAIFETPNPENLQVGACGFYTDPTHLNPLPPQLTNALLELRGFVNPMIVRRDQEQRRQYAPQMVPNSQPGATSINPMVEVMRDNFYVSPDYAVIAAKA